MENILVIIAIAVALFFAIKTAITQAIASVKTDQVEQKNNMMKEVNQSLLPLHDKLTALNQTQAAITDLSRKMEGITHIFSDMQARGSMGEVILEDIVKEQLPPAYAQWQKKLSNGSIPDCTLKLPQPIGQLVIDAKFPIKDFRLYQDAANDAARGVALKQLQKSIGFYVNDIASKYIIANETADKALMFVPSEAIFSLIHEQCIPLVEDARKKGVFIVSPSTLWAILNTMRAVLRDVEMQKQIKAIRTLIHSLTDDAERLVTRAEKLQNHFEAVQKDVKGIATSATKIGKTSQKIAEPEKGNLLSHDED